MKYIVLALILYLSFARVTINDAACEVFTGKFGAAQADGKNATKLQFGGTASFKAGTANLEIQLHYTDDEYFFDTKYKGLTKEDGIDNELTCLDLKLLKFPDNTFNGATQQEITDLTPVASSNESTRWRYLTYTISGDQLKTRLIASESTTNFVYTGYFAIAYYIQTQVQFTYYFSFSVTVNKASSAAVDASFLAISNTETVGCKAGASCTVTPSSSVNFCTNSTCVDTTTSPKIYLNENFWLIQKITTSGLTQNYLSDTKINYVGDGLNKAATIEAADYKTVGQAIYRMKATFAWNKLTIQANSQMKTTAPARRLLAEETSQTSFGESVETCVLVGDSTECPTCDDMLTNNPDGDAPLECSSAKMFILIGIALLSFLF